MHPDDPFLQQMSYNGHEREENEADPPKVLQDSVRVTQRGQHPCGLDQVAREREPLQVLYQ